MLEKTLESPLDCKESKLGNPKGNQPWIDWCWSWNSKTSVTWCKESTHWKKPWCWERLRAGREGDNRGWDGWKSRDTWRNRLVWPWSKNWSRSKANRVLRREHIVRTKTFLQKHKRLLYMCTSPDDKYQNQIDYILCGRRWRSSIQSEKHDLVLTVIVKDGETLRATVRGVTESQTLGVRLSDWTTTTAQCQALLHIWIHTFRTILYKNI